MLRTDFAAMELRLQRDTGEMIAIMEDVQRTYKTVSGLHVYRHKYLYRDVCLICARTESLVFFSFTFICCPKALYEKGGKWTRENSVSYWFIGSYVQFWVTLHRWVSFSCECLCGQVWDTKWRYLDGAICHTWSILGKSTSIDMEYTRLRCERERSHHCVCQGAALTRHMAWRRSRGGVGLGLSGKQLYPATPELTAWRERLADSLQ